MTRAVGVFEWTGDLNKPTASRLVPVSLFIDGHLQDAGVYLARPVPFALSPGYIYAVEKAGEPLGTVDLSEARNMVAQHGAGDDNPLSAWFGYGRYIPPPAAPKAPALHTSAHPGTIVASGTGSAGASAASGVPDTRPHRSDRSADGGAASKGKPTETPAPDPAQSSATAKPEAAPVNAEDSDRPHMSRRSDASTGTTNPADTQASAGGAGADSTTADDDAERPTLRRRDTKAEPKRRKESGSGVRPMATSLNDDPDRPTLHRGSEDTPGATPPLNGNPPCLHQAVAVSDAATVDNHPFAREWESATERASTLAAFQALARPRVANYLAANQLKPGTSLAVAHQPEAASGATSSKAAPPAPGEDTGPAPRLQRGRPAQAPVAAPVSPLPKTQAASTVHTTAAARRSSRPPRPSASRAQASAAAADPPLRLLEEQVAGFTLSYGGVPTFVYSAIVPASDGSAVHITLVAQQLPSGELQVALSSVTDDAHLNRTPWMRLIDAVDPSNSHRASFLFELRAKDSRQFALYSLVSARAEQSFVTGLMQ